MQDFLDYLSKIGSVIRYDNQVENSPLFVVKMNLQSIKDNENAILSPGPKIDPIQTFPIEIFSSKTEDEYISILENLKLLKRTSNMMYDEIDNATELKKSKLNKIFAIFLMQMAPFIKEEFYKELCFFVCMYRKSLNEIGWTTKSNILGRPQDPKEQNLEYCEMNNGEFAPDICNDFITDLLPEYFKNNYNTKNFKVLGPTTEQTKNAVFLTQYLCNWLNANKYTNSRLTINPEGSTP